MTCVEIQPADSSILTGVNSHELLTGLAGTEARLKDALELVCAPSVECGTSTHDTALSATKAPNADMS